MVFVPHRLALDIWIAICLFLSVSLSFPYPQMPECVPCWPNPCLSVFLTNNVYKVPRCKNLHLAVIIADIYGYDGRTFFTSYDSPITV